MTRQSPAPVAVRSMPNPEPVSVEAFDAAIEAFFGHPPSTTRPRWDEAGERRAEAFANTHVSGRFAGEEAQDA